MVSGKSRVKRLLRCRRRPDFGDAIVEGMVDSIRAFCSYQYDSNGEDILEVEIAEGVSIRIGRELGSGWISRITSLGEVAQSIAQQYELDQSDVFRRLYQHDGWVMSGGTLKTPIWMRPHREVLVDDLPAKLIWLKKHL